MLIDMSLVTPSYHDRHLLLVSRKIREILEERGEWKFAVQSTQAYLVLGETRADV